MRSTFLLACCYWWEWWWPMPLTRPLRRPGPCTTPAPVTDNAVIGMCGERLVKLFRRFGTPEDLYPNRGDDTTKDSVTLDYGNFGFRVRNKSVIICYFWSGFPSAVRGIKIGDTRDSAVKTLGSTYQTYNNTDGVQDYGWDLKDDDATLWACFGTDNTIKSIQIEPK